jgi:enoyl-CoA hydratase/carnithine racemase
MTAASKMIAEKRGRVGLLVFNNPERHNAVSLEMWRAADGMLDDFLGDAGVRVVVLTGAGGKAFVSGADISKFEDERATEEAVKVYNEAVERMYGRIYGLKKPTIAMIRGYCIGGGLGLAACCDIRVANEKARFSLPAARLGLGYGYSGLRRFLDTFGPAVTKEIFFTARQYDAQEALRMGMVNHVVSDDELEPKVMEMADSIADNAPLTVAAVKQIVQEAMKDAGERDLAKCEALVRACFASRDYVEGRRAFLEKRKPAFIGA